MLSLLLLVPALALAGPVDLFGRDSACNADNCLRAVRATAYSTRNGAADCAAFFAPVTVTPATSTVVSTVLLTATSLVSTSTTTTTVVSETPTDTVDVTNTVTVTAIATTTSTSLSTVYVTAQYKRAPSDSTTTASTPSIPSYASACSNDVSRYASACSCVGVTQPTVTAPTPLATSFVSTTVATTTITVSTISSTEIDTTTATTATTTIFDTATTTVSSTSTVVAVSVQTVNVPHPQFTCSSGYTAACCSRWGGAPGEATNCDSYSQQSYDTCGSGAFAGTFAVCCQTYYGSWAFGGGCSTV